MGKTPEWCEHRQLRALVDLKNVGHQDDPWVLADRVAQVFYLLDPETGKHVIIFGKQKIVRVENVEDNDEDVNQFEEIPLFTNPMNIKRIEKYFDKNLMLYMQKGGKGNFAWFSCMEKYVSYFILMLIFVCMVLN
jgi:hypothetical protein